ncbi:MAG: protein-glutamate O-methyltransferase [Alphaproteobacteria bacterium]
MSAAAASPKTRSEALVEAEFVLSRRNFENIAGLLRTESGIHLPESKAMLVYSRLAKRLRQTGCPDFDAYWELIDSPAGAQERQAMFAALTTNVTRFFREPHHFDHLKKTVLPELVATARAGGRVRLWSSACSTGEEPYSIALTVLDMLPEAARLDVKILATDIDPVVVATARAGIYRADVQSVVPQPLRDKWLARDRESGAWRVKDEVKALVTFNQLNLIGAWPIKGPFDVIFCRNVVIYFEDETQAHVWGRFHKMLAPEGRLYVGHSERVDVPGYVSDGLTVYRKTGGRA